MRFSGVPSSVIAETPDMPCPQSSEYSAKQAVDGSNLLEGPDRSRNKSVEKGESLKTNPIRGKLKKSQTRELSILIFFFFF